MASMTTSTNGVMIAMAPSSFPFRRNLPFRSAEGDFRLVLSVGTDRSS
jgi:hypothetical protein